MFAPEQLQLQLVCSPALTAPDLPAAASSSSSRDQSTTGKAGTSTTTTTTKLKRRQPAAAAPSNVRSWLRVDAGGEASLMQADKHRLAQKLGVQGRDLRVLDPSLSTSYPAAILCRERALVVSMEHIKVIITTSSVLVINPEDEAVLPFISELKMKLSQSAQLHCTECTPHPSALNGLAKLHGSSAQCIADGSASSGIAAGSEGAVQLQLEGLVCLQMPFELKALEVCLDSVASYLNRLCSDLEAAAYPALDSLTGRVTAHNLERVRRIKGRLVRLTTRVENVRSMLEGYLDDDQDMRGMNLTAKEAHAQQQQQLEETQQHHNKASSGNSHTHSSSSSSSSGSSMAEEEVAPVEMLLEASFMALDHTLNRLQTLNEYIQDTEDLVNLKLDQHRNQLIGIDLLLTGFTCSLAIMTAVAGYFGMNLNSFIQQEPVLFNLVTLVTTLGSLALFGGFVALLWHRQLLRF